MVMSHIYQPLMLKVLLDRGGEATVRDLAAAFLAADQSQLEYYEMIVNRYPRATLRKHGLVVNKGPSYRLDEGLTGLSVQERAVLSALCQSRIDAYLARRGRAPWSHRMGPLDPLPGRAWFAVIERARKRCEACGVSSEVRALHVDHIVPRSCGGSNDLDNLQALCVTCNLQKGNRSQTDFSELEAEYSRSEPDCPCCRVLKDGADGLAGIVDRSEDRIVLAPKRHVASWFELGQAEVNALRRLEVEVAGGAGRRVREIRIPTDPSVQHCRVVVEVSRADHAGSEAAQ